MTKTVIKPPPIGVIMPEDLPIVKPYRCKRWRYRQKVPVVVHREVRYGFEITIINNKTYHNFRYEYVIYAPKNRMRDVPAITRDPTSQRRKVRALSSARSDVMNMKASRISYVQRIMKELFAVDEEIQE